MSIETISGLTPEEQEFVDLSRGRLESQLEELERPIPWHVAHGRIRPRKQMQEIQRQRKKQIGEVERALQALRGDGNIEITFIRDDKDGTILGFKT